MIPDGDKPLTIVFICTGNVCRSPMAEYMLRERLAGRPGWTVVSAGVAAGRGMPASRAAVEALREVGIDLDRHRSRPVDKDLVDESLLAVVMTAAHRGHMQALYPGADDKLYVLGDFAPPTGRGDVADPIGMSLDVYREVRDQIGAALPGLISFTECLQRKK